MKSKLLKTAILILPLLCIIILSSPVFALGIGVTPGKLNFDVSPGSTTSQTLNIVNQSDSETTFRIYTDDDFKEWFNIQPAEFVLGAHKIKDVKVVVSPPLMAKQNLHSATIYIISTPPESKLQLGAGIKVVANVQIMPTVLLRVELWIIAGGALLAIILGILIWRKYRNNRYGYY
jgi:uncharacterized membrane protein